MRALSLVAACPSASAFAVSVPGSAPPSTSASTSAVFVPGLSTLLSSALLSASGISVPVPRSSALLSSALLSASGVSMLVLGSLALPSVSSISGVSIPVPRSSVPPFVSGVPVRVPESSPLPFPIWSNLQTPTPIPERQRLSQWSEILKKASSEEASTTFAPLFPPSKRPSPLFFSFSGIGKKWPFDNAFNINCWPLANDHAKEDVGKRKFDKTFINSWPLANNHAKKEVDLSFAGCGCSPRVKLNRPWQIELLE